MDFINAYFYKITIALVVAGAAWLGVQVRTLYCKYVTTEIKQAVCRTAVRFVEQVYKDVHGRDKLKAAMKKASELLTDKGIPITDEELEMLLEAAVNEFNDAFTKTDPVVKAKAEMEKSFHPPLPEL